MILSERKNFQFRHGAYLNSDNDAQYLLKDIARWQDMPLYVSCHLDLQWRRALRVHPLAWFESDAPVQAAIKGQVFTSAGMLDLKEVNTVTQFEVIDATCECPVCKQGLTRAYLSHLYINTPLLCQRFLAQHNVCYEVNVVPPICQEVSG